MQERKWPNFGLLLTFLDMTKNGISNNSDENESFDIWAEEIPDDASVTDLCDCG